MATEPFSMEVDVQAHGNTVINVLFTNKAEVVAAAITAMEGWLERDDLKIVGLDLEYDHDPETGKATKAALI